MMNCFNCANYMNRIDHCKFCHYENKGHKRDDWDILNLDDDVEWSHLQILDRLHSNGIECFTADMWVNDNVAWLLGCNATSSDIAKALRIHEECVYNEEDQSFVILNLFQEKWLRGLLDE